MRDLGFIRTTKVRTNEGMPKGVLGFVG